MAEVQERPKVWAGVVSAELPRVSAADAWRHVSDFFNIDKWLPAVAECHKVEDAGQGVSVRHVVGPPGQDGKPLYWAKEQLTDKDDSAFSINYKIVDSNTGYRRYLAVMKVVPSAGGGCKIDWSYDTDPIPGWSLEVLVGFMQSGLDTMATRIEEATAKASSGSSA